MNSKIIIECNKENNNNNFLSENDGFLEKNAIIYSE
jgi:hypothetical protein